MANYLQRVAAAGARVSLEAGPSPAALPLAPSASYPEEAPSGAESRFGLPLQTPEAGPSRRSLPVHAADMQGAVPGSPRAADVISNIGPRPTAEAVRNAAVEPRFEQPEIPSKPVSASASKVEVRTLGRQENMPDPPSLKAESSVPQVKTLTPLQVEAAASNRAAAEVGPPVRTPSPPALSLRASPEAPHATPGDARVQPFASSDGDFAKRAIPGHPDVIAPKTEPAAVLPMSAKAPASERQRNESADADHEPPRTLAAVSDNTASRSAGIKPPPPIPVTQASPVLPPPVRSPGPESQITIGRIDVLVNNEAPPRVPVPAPRAAPGWQSELRTRFLDRFTLRP